MNEMVEGFHFNFMSSANFSCSARSFFYVEYDSHRNAALARRMLVPGNVFLFDMPIQRVDWAEPDIEVDDEIMAQVHILGLVLCSSLGIE